MEQAQLAILWRRSRSSLAIARRYGYALFSVPGYAEVRRWSSRWRLETETFVLVADADRAGNA